MSGATQKASVQARSDGGSMKDGSRAAGLAEVRAGNITVIRRKDLWKLFQARYGLTLPDDQAGREDTALMLAHIAAGADPDARMDHFLDLRCPWMPTDERDMAKELAASARVTWTADELAALVGLTMAERTRLNITTIGAIDCNAAARKAIRLEKQRRRQREYRRAAREQPKPLPSITDRAFAIRDAVPEKGWRAIKSICKDLASSPAFAGLSAIKGAAHTALKEAESRGLVRVRQQPGVRGLPVTFVSRAGR